MSLRLGFLASHRGSNMQSVVQATRSGALRAEPAVVISNNSKAGALEFARANGIPWRHLSGRTHPHKDELDRAILATLQAHNVNVVLLVGYMKLLGPCTLAAYRGRMLNIHPALLPKYGGKGMYGEHVHKAVLAAGETSTGVTIHIVDEIYDHGRILAQCHVPIREGDTPESLAARVLDREHTFLVETLQRIESGEIDLD